MISQLLNSFATMYIIDWLVWAFFFKRQSILWLHLLKCKYFLVLYSSVTKSGIFLSYGQCQTFEDDKIEWKPREIEGKQRLAEGHFSSVDSCWQEETVGNREENELRKAIDEMETIHWNQPSFWSVFEQHFGSLSALNILLLFWTSDFYKNL